MDVRVHRHPTWLHLPSALQGSPQPTAHAGRRIAPLTRRARKSSSTCLHVPQGSPSAADIMVVGSSDTASTTAFLQCLAWDPVNEQFNFYARSRQAPAPSNSLIADSASDTVAGRNSSDMSG